MEATTQMSKPNRLFPLWRKSKKGERIPGERAPRPARGVKPQPEELAESSDNAGTVGGK
jgi:hypothetical protein